MLQTGLSVLAVVLSVVTLGVTYRSWQLADRRSRIPVLVFLQDAEHRWLLRNVGNGPALNVIVASKASHDDDHWQDPTRVPPLAKDGELVLTWIAAHDPAVLGATYQDFLAADTSRRSRTYTAICAYNVSRVTPGRHLPNWGVSESKPHWSRERYDTTAGP